VFQFGIGHEAHAVLITDRTYNSNNWTEVRAKRLRRQGNLILEAVRSFVRLFVIAGRGPAYSGPQH